MAPGAVPVINFSDDDDIDHHIKSTPIDILDDHDDYEDEYGDLDFNRLHKASSSSNNYDSLFSHNQADFHKDQDDSDCVSRNSAAHVDNGLNVENEFKILMYLEDKNEMVDDAHDSDQSYSKSKGVKVEKRLDNIFKQEVPLTNIYYDNDGKEIISVGKAGSSDQSSTYYPIKGGIFITDQDLSLVKDSRISQTDQAFRVVQMEKIAAFDSMHNMMNPMMASNFNLYNGFETGAFLFPFNVSQMAFQCSELPPQMIDVPKKKPIILDQTQERFTGKLKFFDEIKGYGFIVKDDDDKDIFCHYDDFCKANISIAMLRAVKIGQVLRLSFSCLSYIGRHNKSKKAVDLQFISISPNPALTTMAGMGMLSGLNTMAMVQMPNIGHL